MWFVVACWRFDILGHATFKPVILLNFTMPVILCSCRFWPSLISFFYSISFISFHWISRLKSANQNRNLTCYWNWDWNRNHGFWNWRYGIGIIKISMRIKCHYHAYVEWGILLRWFHTIIFITKKIRQNIVLCLNGNHHLCVCMMT